LPPGQQPSQAASPHYVSKRSWTFWEKVRSWYPNKLPAECPPDYCKLIDASDRERLAGVLSNMRQRHPAWPPTFPEFALLFTEQEPQQSIDWPSIQERFAKSLIDRGLVTYAQCRAPWTWHGVGDVRTGEGFKFTSVTVPARDGAPQKTFQMSECP
jgi:hypothetical protein